MASRESALFTATALPAGLAALGFTGWLVWSQAPDLAELWPELLLIQILAILSYALSFSASGRDRTSLEIGYIIGAILLFPFPAPLLLAAVTALVGSLLRGARGLGAVRLASITGANIAVACTMTAMAALVHRALALPIGAATDLLGPLPSSTAWRLGARMLPIFVMAAALYLVMNAVNLVMMLAWIVLRRQSALAYARPFLSHIFLVETVNVPFACLLAFTVRSGAGAIGILVLGALGVFVGVLLKRISASEDRLRRANDGLETRLDELATLNAIGREISSSLDAGRVFEILRRECRKVFRPDLVWIAAVDADSSEARVEWAAAGETSSRTTTVPRTEGLVARVLEDEQPLLLRDAPRELGRSADDPGLFEPGIRSVVAVPLRVESRLAGILSVQAFREEAYDNHHVTLLTTIGQQVAVALENARHYQLATVDQLTGLFHRDYFFQRLGDEHRRSTRYGTAFSLLMLDLDSFKKINDRFGHFAGDRFLRAVGGALKSTLRASDVPCRYGGEEFCILLPETDPTGARIIAEKIRAEIAALRVAEGAHRLHTTLSAGLASFPDHFEGSLPGLLQKADQALYAAKKGGKDRVSVAA